MRTVNGPFFLALIFNFFYLVRAIHFCEKKKTEISLFIGNEQIFLITPGKNDLGFPKFRGFEVIAL